MSSFEIDCEQVSDMSDSSSENESGKTSRSHKVTSSGDSNPGDTTSSPLLKKGPWTTAEDEILADYVNKHGEGNWNAVQKYSGLSRCGKSCRLRWANHLRPDLKKGAFSQEEENLIVELHAKMGNKWARMAAELPGRTDNEIKNYWNTRTKRLQRAGLPIYPPEVCMNEGNHGEDAGSGENHTKTSQVNEYDIPMIEFKGTPTLIDLPSNCIMNNNNTQNFGFIHPSIPLQKPYPISILSPNGCFSSFPQNPPYTAKPLWPYSCNPNPNTEDSCPMDVLPGNISSTSEPISAMKLELPSLQYAAALPVVGSSRAPCSPLPSLESVDTLIQTDCPSPRNCGLLEAIVYESQSIKNPNDHFLNPQNVDETTLESIDDPTSPRTQSRWSALIDQYMAGSSSEQPQPGDANQGFNCTEESPDSLAAYYSDVRNDWPNHLVDMRSDFFESFWFTNRSLLRRDQSISADIALIFADDMNTEYEQAGGA